MILVVASFRIKKAVRLQSMISNDKIKDDIIIRSVEDPDLESGIFFMVGVLIR
jgi:hypothetical protein